MKSTFLTNALVREYFKTYLSEVERERAYMQESGGGDENKEERETPKKISC